MRQISISELRKNFERYVEQVSAGAEFVVTKHGKPLCRFQAIDQTFLADSDRAARAGAQRP